MPNSTVTAAHHRSDGPRRPHPAGPSADADVERFLAFRRWRPIIATMPRTVPPHRDAYPHVLRIPTRWHDNDVYGHVNNVIYYAFFDTVVNGYLMREGGLDFAAGDAVGLVVETTCRYHEPVSFPDVVDAGLRVAHIGTTSVRYEIGLFRNGAEAACADGHFVHVYVDRETRRPVSVPAAFRVALAPLLQS
jgi:acyl-CoA thioester hydrolase